MRSIGRLAMVVAVAGFIFTAGCSQARNCSGNCDGQCSSSKEACAGNSCGKCAEAKATSSEKKGASNTGGAETITQKTCPVGGKEINTAVFTEYQGKKVYFCCPGCIDRFKADPDKYMAKLN